MGQRLLFVVFIEPYSKVSIAVRRWYRSRKNAVVACSAVALSLLWVMFLCYWYEPNLVITRRYLEEALKLDKGMGCEMPLLDPFSKEITQFDKQLPPIKCNGTDWVKCYHSRCRVVDEIKETVRDITCMVFDIIYETDFKQRNGPPIKLKASGSYELTASDHVKVKCSGKTADGKLVKWAGNTLGFRSVKQRPTPPGRENSLNVLIFGFDSTSRNGFIRRMPKSWKVLTEELGATVLEGYNVLGDGTPAAIFPILTGKTELELPDVRRRMENGRTLDKFPFIFYKVKSVGYRTAYFEDMPNIGTFQYRFNGFKQQPTDHYLRAFFVEEMFGFQGGKVKYCVGDTPQFKVMMNITEQFMALDGKRFAFTFIVDISHDDFNLMQSADEDTATFLRAFRAYSEDTLLVVMGDHGPRYAHVRDTLQGKFEERLPLLALVLPKALVLKRPAALPSLQANARVLTTAHDLHATILDVLDMTEHWNSYKVKGADLKRGLTLLEPIPRNRSCSEAGIEPHWCACVAWQNVSATDPLYNKTGRALLAYINELLRDVTTQCMPRTLISTDWVLRQRPNSRVITFLKNSDLDGIFGDFTANTRITRENYQIKIVVGPGRAFFEASMTYIYTEDKFIIRSSEISRTNAYNTEPSCISKTHSQLNNYCYCR